MCPQHSWDFKCSTEILESTSDCDAYGCDHQENEDLCCSSQAYLAINSSTDYEHLCALDVLGLADTPTGDQGDVYVEFKEQLTRSSDSWYESALPWKGNHPELPNNYDGSICQLHSLVRKLHRMNMLSDL
jgi:hypothetical protein